MRNLKDRLDRLEQDSAERLRTVQCGQCRDWRPVCVKRIDADGTETWETDQPQECPNCGWTADLVVLQIAADWRSVSTSGRSR